MESVSMNEFQSDMVNIFRKIGAGEVIMITSHGRELAKLVPPDNNTKKTEKIHRELPKIDDVISLKKRPEADEWETEWLALAEAVGYAWKDEKNAEKVISEMTPPDWLNNI